MRSIFRKFSLLLSGFLFKFRLEQYGGLLSQVRVVTMTELQLSSNEIGNMVNKALACHKNGEIDEALRAYTDVLPFVSDSIRTVLHSNMAAIFLSADQAIEAEKQYILAIELSPENAQAHFNYAVLLTSKLQQHSKAFYHCKVALKLQPEFHKALHLMGNILQSQGNFITAEKFFIRAEEVAREAITKTSLVYLPRLPVFSPSVSARKFRYNSSLEDTKTSEQETSAMLVSSRPLIFRVDNLLTSHECDFIIHRANEKLHDSFVMGGGDIEGNRPTHQYGELSEPLRVSRNAWLSPDHVLTALQQRIASLVGLPLQYMRRKSEELQVVQYESGGRFNAHHDSSTFHPRLLTALVYLNDVVTNSEMGGTWFPFASKESCDNPLVVSCGPALSINSDISTRRDHGDMGSESENQPEAADSVMSVTETVAAASAAFDIKGSVPLPGVVFKPRKGDAVIFFNHLSSGEIDAAAVHAGLPVGQVSTKWIANYWVELDEDTLAECIRDAEAEV